MMLDKRIFCLSVLYYNIQVWLAIARIHGKAVTFQNLYKIHRLPDAAGPFRMTETEESVGEVR